MKDIFNGETAFEAFCSFWDTRVHRHQYRAAGCTTGCATLDIDCNTGDDEGIINITYVRTARILVEQITVFGIYKRQRSNQDGRFLLFKNKGGMPVQEGCETWMQSPLSWCEGPKWSQKEDDEGLASVDMSQGVEWKLTYNWLSFSEQDSLWVLEEDVVRGQRHPDMPLVAGLKSEEEFLGSDIGTVGPHVDTTYLIGSTGFTDTCFDNDKAMGMDIPLAEEKVCDIHMWKANPNLVLIVQSQWFTTHYPTELKDRFSL